MSDYDFKDLCKDLKHKLPANLHATKEEKDFMWIATKYYDIGAYPIHYEIRLENGKVYAEIHYESDGTISYISGKSNKDLYTEFQQLFSVKKSYSCSKNTKTYLWYRKNNSGVDFNEDCVEEVLNDLKTLVQDTRDDLLKLMNKTFK